MDPSPSEIEALVRLLDDPDEDVQQRVQSRLDTLGRAALPTLRDVRDEAPPDLRERIDGVVHRLHMADVRSAWNEVLSRSPVDLERGAFLIALYRFPQLDVMRYQQQLDEWARALQPEIQARSGPERALRLAEYVTDDLGLSGNREHYYDPNNSYLNRVIDRRRGIPITLSVLYVFLGQRLDLPVCGVNMPAHYLVKYADGQQELFLDLFNDGARIAKEDCVRFLLKAGIRPVPFYFECAEPKDTLLRMVRNLLAIAKEAHQEQTARELMQLLAPHDPNVEMDDISPQ